MPFAKGQSGNPGGRGTEKPWRDALRIAVARKAEDGGKLLAKAAEACVKAAIAGDIQAMKEIGDRLDGKPKQQTEVTGTDGGPLQFQQVERVIVDPQNRDAEGL